MARITQVLTRPKKEYKQEVLDQWKKDFPEMGGGITDIIPEGPV